MANSFNTNNGHVTIVDGTIQIENSIRCSIRRLFNRSKLMFMFVFIPIVWTLSSLVIDHWLFPTAVGKLFLVFLGLPLLVMVGITRLAIALPTGITTASRIPVDTVDHVTFEEHRFGPTQITIHYENDGDMKN